MYRQFDSPVRPKYGNVQNALDQAHIDLLAAVARFDTEAEQISCGPNLTKMSDEQLRMFVEGCWECWVGNFNWRRVQTDRFSDRGWY